MRKFNQFIEFQKTISNIKKSNISNPNFINYVKNQLNQAQMHNTITKDEYIELISNLKTTCFYLGITI